jgi:hypothetical protein
MDDMDDWTGFCTTIKERKKNIHTQLNLLYTKQQKMQENGKLFHFILKESWSIKKNK